MSTSQNDDEQTQDENQGEISELIIEFESPQTQEMAKALGELIVEKGDLDGMVVEEEEGY